MVESDCCIQMRTMYYSKQGVLVVFSVASIGTISLSILEISDCGAYVSVVVVFYTSSQRTENLPQY